MNVFKQKCIELRRKDYTLSDIVRITGRPKTSIYTHIQNIPLSQTKQAAIRRASGERIRPFGLLRKGKSNRPFIRFDTWTDTTVFLVAHLLFDGEINRGVCSYNNRNKVLIRRVQKCMKSAYTFPPALYFNKQTGVFRISYFNVTLRAYMQVKSHELLSNITTFCPRLKKKFLKAFFDDEGCMDYRHNRNIRQVRGYQKDIKILRIVKSLLAIFGIEAKIVLPNEVVISGKKSLERFQKEINFSKGVRINGNRSNSIWKKSFEKRNLLHMAIASFKS